MTAEDSNQYKQRHNQIKNLTKELSAFDGLTIAPPSEAVITKRKLKKMRGTVQRVLKPFLPSELEKVQISVDEAEELYREIRIENVLTDENGEKVQLKPALMIQIRESHRTPSTLLRRTRFQTLEVIDEIKRSAMPTRSLGTSGGVV